MRLPSLAESPIPAPTRADAEGEVQVWHERGEVCGVGYVARGGSWLHLPGVATFELGPEVVAHGLSATPELVRYAFEGSVLPMALQVLGGEALHASAVLGPPGVVALCGESGTGKSTLARALSERRYLLWADDAVAFEEAQNGIRAIPLPFSGSPERRAEPLAVAVILRRDAAPSNSSRRLTGGAALSAVLEQAYCFRPSDSDRRQAMVAAYLDLVARVPVVELRFRPVWDELEQLVDELEEIIAAS